MSEDGLCQSHHLCVCLSAHSEPSAAILSLNYCNQHIPANHTHACMHTRTCVLNSKHLNMKHCRPHVYPDITLSQDLMAHIFPAESTNNIWSKITGTEHSQPHTLCHMMRNCFCPVPYFTHFIEII